MAQPLVMGDKIQGQCAIHQIPNPASGRRSRRPRRCRSPRRCSTGLEPTVTIGGKAVAVVGSSGYNTPPHVGLHASDPFMVPTTQQGMVAERQPDGDRRRQADRDVELAGGDVRPGPRAAAGDRHRRDGGVRRRA